MLKKTSAVLIVVSLLISCKVLKANMIAYNTYGTFGAGDSLLYSMDLGTGTQTLIGSTGLFNIRALEYSTITGKLYAYEDGLSLYEIDTLTAQATFIGGGAVMQNLAFAPNGTLYGTGTNGLYQIDVQNGSQTFIGSLPFSEWGGFAIDGTGRGIFIETFSGNKIYEIDLTTASSNLLGTLDGDFEGECDAMDFGPDGVFYGWENHNFYSIDLDTLETTDIYTLSEGANAFAIVPEPATLLLLGLGGLAVLRKNKS